MSDQPSQLPSSPDPALPGGDPRRAGPPSERPEADYAIESAPDEEPAAPRRAASATFVVDSRPGDEAALRAAMDPANQSLGEALRLSYRLLQFVILVLLVLFLFSGFQTVREGYTGVRTLFGRIYGTPGSEQLEPGFTPFWPYPVGEIVTFPVRRSVELDHAFFPTFRNNNVTFQQAVESAAVSELLRPGIDNYVLSADGDIVHLQLGADYVIDDAVAFLRNVGPANSDEIVKRIVQRAMVHTASRLTTAEIVDSREEPIVAVQQEASRTLLAMREDRVGIGVALADIRMPLRTVALAVRKEAPSVQSAIEDAKAAVERAREEAERTLNGVAGRRYPDLIAAIDRYGEALSAGDPTAAEVAFREVGTMLESTDITGQASLIISRARSTRTKMESSLGNEYRRFASILPAWRKDPMLVTRRLWLETYNDVMGGSLVEVFNVPTGLRDVLLRLKSDENLMQERRRAELDRRKRDFAAEGMSEGTYILRGRDTGTSGPGRRVGRDAQSGFGKSN